MDDTSLDLGEAAVLLGVSPTAVARLLDRGLLPWTLGADGRHRRVSRADLERHRDDRFALRQRRAAERILPPAPPGAERDGMRVHASLKA